MADDQGQAQTLSTDAKIKIAGSELAEGVMQSFFVDMDLSQPDMCVVTVKNDDFGPSSTYNLADPVEVTIGQAVLFKGEIVGLEPIYRAGEPTRLVVRAFNRLHRLLRGKKSRTFLEQSDQDIVSTIAGDHGLSPSTDSATSVVHKHVYQVNASDLDFLRGRAHRIGYEVWVEDQTLHFKPPKVDRDSGIELNMPGPGEGAVRLLGFAPRLSSAGMVEKVTVRGWNPEQKEEIVGEASAQSSRLGASAGYSKAKSAFGSVLTYEVDHPIYSVEEAQAIAKSKLDEMLMSYITGEAECMGRPDLKPGIVVKVVVNASSTDYRFNGKYFIAGASHRFTQASGVGDDGGYRAMLRLRRDAEGGQ